MCKIKYIDYLIIVITFFIILLISNACGSDNENLTEPENYDELVGVWKICQMSWSSQVVSGSYCEAEIDSLGLIWQLNLNSNKSAEQITNISGPLTTQPGRWLIDGNELSLTLKGPYSGEYSTLIYQYILDDSILKLMWSLSAEMDYTAQFTKQ